MSEPIKAEAAGVPNPSWDDTDVQRFRDYLSRNGKFLNYLAARRPKIEGKTMEEVALTGARHAGFEIVFDVITAMATQANPADRSPFIGND